MLGQGGLPQRLQCQSDAISRGIIASRRWLAPIREKRVRKAEAALLQTHTGDSEGVRWGDEFDDGSA